jgi:hypothetical protein
VDASVSGDDALAVFARVDDRHSADSPAAGLEPLFESPGEPASEEAAELPPLSSVQTPIEETFGESLARLSELLGSGEPEKIRAFLASEALTEPDEAGRTALMAAAHLGDPTLVRVLVDAGRGVDACDRTEAGQTALVYAVNSVSAGRDEVVSILAGAGADLDRRCGRNQRTALMHAAEADVYLDREQGKVFAQTTKNLVELGADLEIPDRRGRTVWRLIKRDALGAPTFSQSRRRLHQMLRVLEYLGAEPIASHEV